MLSCISGCAIITSNGKKLCGFYGRIVHLMKIDVEMKASHNNGDSGNSAG